MSDNLFRPFLYYTIFTGGVSTVSKELFNTKWERKRFLFLENYVIYGAGQHLNVSVLFEGKIYPDKFPLSFFLLPMNNSRTTVCSSS